MKKRQREDGSSGEAVEEEGNPFNVCEVNRFNLDMLYKVIVSAAASCDFMALDTEFSGLDLSPESKSGQLQERYGSFSDMVEKYALLQFGLSFVSKKGPNKGHYRSLSFTFHVVRSSPFVVAPRSMIFLAENGLSLTDVFKRGVQFDLPSPGAAPGKLEQLWRAIAALHKPLVVHNGLADLMFVWRSFFGPLPALATDFVKTFSQAFPVCYDTKYLSVALANENATYLQHLFRASYVRNMCTFECAAIPLQYQILTDSATTDVPTEICNQYAKHGNCRFGLACTRSHDVDFIVQVEYAVERGLPAVMASKPNNSNQRNLQRPQMSHSAGFDAFATAYVFGMYLEKLDETKMMDAANHIYLMSSDRPLLLIPSRYE